MGRPLKTMKSTTKDLGYPNFSDREAPVKNSANTLNNNQYIGVVGGEDFATTTFPVLKCRVFVTGQGSETDGVIIRQKGATKYLVEDTGGNQGVCILADEADGALTEGNMNITFSLDDSTANRVKRLTNRYILDYSDNRYLANFFTDEGTMIKSGSANNGTMTIGIIESYT